VEDETESSVGEATEEPGLTERKYQAFVSYSRVIIINVNDDPPLGRRIKAPGVGSSNLAFSPDSRFPLLVASLAMFWSGILPAVNCMACRYRVMIDR
jgi:hypothetical protein